MVFRYSDLEVTSEKLDVEVPHVITKAADETGELWFMNENFGSYLTDNEGYGIAFGVQKITNTVYEPDYWYDF